MFYEYAHLILKIILDKWVVLSPFLSEKTELYRGKRMGSKWQTWEPNSGHPALNRYNTLFLLKKERKVRFHPFHAHPRS